MLEVFNYLCTYVCICCYVHTHTHMPVTTALWTTMWSNGLGQRARGLVDGDCKGPVCGVLSQYSSEHHIGFVGKVAQFRQTLVIDLSPYCI